MQEHKGNQFLEHLAAFEHERWAHWMRYLFTQGTLEANGSFRIHPASVDRWRWQMETSYVNLPDDMRESDRAEVRLRLRRLYELVHNPDLLAAALVMRHEPEKPSEQETTP